MWLALLQKVEVGPTATRVDHREAESTATLSPVSRGIPSEPRGQMGRLNTLREIIQKTALAAILKSQQIQYPQKRSRGIRQTIGFSMNPSYD
jgi:hypothetical protein